MKYKITHTTRYTYSEPAPVCHNQVHLTPRHTPHQNCEQHRLLVHPTPADRRRRLDYFGNQVDYFSIHEAHRDLTVTAVSRVEVIPTSIPDPASTPPWEQVAADLGLEAVQFTYSSTHIQLTPALEAKLAKYAGPSFSSSRPILEAARDLTARIHDDFAYEPKSTTIHTSLDEVLKDRRGVCQDFAHLQIGCLRALGLPARYVSGYLRTSPPPGKPRLVGADASHAWLAVHCGPAGWIDLDPTNNVTPTIDHITLAWGRDYSDVCPIQGVFVGGGQHSMNVSVDVAPLE